MPLAAWIAVCAVASFALRRHTAVAIVLILALRVLVPSVASAVVVGRAPSSLAFHPAVWLIGTTLVITVLSHGAALVRTVAQHVFLVLTLVLVVTVAVLTTKTSIAGSGVVLLIDQVAAPVGLFLLIVTTCRADRRAFTTLRNALLGLAAMSAGLAIAQWLTNSVIFYGTYYATDYWFLYRGFDRWMATLDHPLTLSFFLCIAAPLTVGIASTWWRITLLTLSTMAVVITQSRTGVIVIGLTIVYVILRSRASALAKAAMYAVLTIGTFVLVASPVAAGIVGRFQNDTGSSEARAAAYQFFFDHWTQYFFTGGGVTSSYRIAQAAGLGTSLESSFLMYSVDIGIVFATLYFGSQLVIVLRGPGRSAVPGLAVASVIALVLPHTYSALAAASAVGALLWTVLGLVVASYDISHLPTPPELGQAPGTKHELALAT
ncbi:MAG TPA: hypothetical protein VMV41_06130 [Cellulomonadaceae bacterium]|nr:hypothetical protein [Cellulomonadaceae bacterium]